MRNLQHSMNCGTKALDQVANKHVVFLMGKTGSGKSTLIQGIAGKEIKEAVHKTTRFGQSVTKAVFVANDGLPGFEIGHSKKSMTKCVRCYVPQITTAKTADIVYVDLPGFEDTDGPEIDIATSVMISQVVKRCKSVRFILLINYTSLLEDRGGSIRGVLKLVKNFVSDFSCNKNSFTFLFTHTCEIKEIPEDLAGARASLLKELIRTADGTNQSETDVLGIVEHMIKCLQKRVIDPSKRRYQIVDVLHPTKTDFADLKVTVEGMKSVEKKYVAGNCGLTPQLQLKLDAGLATLLYRLKLLLNETTLNDLNEVKEILDMLQFFEQYIDIEAVGRKVAESASLAEKHAEKLCEIVVEETRRGTTMDCRFSASNVDAIQNAMNQLRVFNPYCADGKGMLELEGHIEQEVRAFQRHAMTHDASCFQDLHIVLGNLYTWSQGFEEFSALYKKSRSHIVRLLQGTCKSVSSFAPERVGTLSRDSLSIFVQKVHDLEAIVEGSERLLKHNIDLSMVRETASEARAKMVGMVESVSFPQECLADAASVATALECLQELVRSHLSFPQFIEVCNKKLLEMAEDITGHFSKLFATLKKGRSKFDASWQEPLMKVRNDVALFEELQGIGWEKIRIGYFSCIDMIKKIMEARITELELRAQETLRRGFKNGKEDGEAMTRVASCQWVDEFLHADSCFAAVSVGRIWESFRKRTERVAHDVDMHLSALLEGSSDCSQSLPYLQDWLLPELHQIALFGNGLMDKESEALAQLLRCVELCKLRMTDMLERWENAAKQWKVEIAKPKCGNLDIAMQQKLYEFGRALNMMLGVMETLVSVHPAFRIATITFSEIRETVQCRFKKFTMGLHSVVKGKGRYVAKEFSLSLADELATYSSITVEGLEGIKKTAEMSVDTHADVIEKMVSADETWEKINKEMNIFEKATLIDRFISNKASLRIEQLRNAREEKQEGIAGNLQDLIEKKDYHGMIYLLEPYAGSTNQPDKRTKKFFQIASSVMLEIVESAICLLSRHSIDSATVQQVAKDIEILKLADEKLRKFLIGNGLYLPRDIDKVKTKVNKILTAKIEEMTTAAERIDFLSLGAGKLVVNAFAESSIHYCIEKQVQTKMKAALSKYEETIKSVSNHLDGFFASCLSEGASLLGDLTSLKLAHDHDSPKLEELAENYKKILRELVNRLNESFCDIALAVEQRGCYDEAIGWLHGLERHLTLGLQEHVSCKDLKFDCTSQLEEWRSQRLKYDRELDFEGAEASESLDKWARSLDRLHPTWWVPRFFRAGSDSSYQRLCTSLEGKVWRCYDKGKVAITTTKDFVLAQECIGLLDMISNKVGKHIVTAAERREELKKVALDSFLRLCDEAQKELKAGGIKHFQRLFPDYRSFVLHVPFTMSSDLGKQSFSSTNQLVFQILDSDLSDLKKLLDSLEFPDIKQAIESLRICGCFVADRFTLLHEEVECSGHANVDRWLEKIQSLCVTYFSCGRDLGRIKHYAVLGLYPSASSKEIKLAHTTALERLNIERDGSAQHGEGLQATLRNVECAHRELTKQESPTLANGAQPFDNLLRGIGDGLREKVRAYLRDQNYDLVEKLLFKLDGLSLLDDLVSPPLESRKTCQGIVELVQQHVAGVRVEVESNWSERKYKLLNDNIVDLKQMEASFKSYPNIFPKSWKAGVLGEIESEIESLGMRARGYLVNKTMASQKFDDFRRCLLRMGSVLDELPWFRDCTKSTMSSVLETCLNTDWGHAFVFELGLSLQRGDEHAVDEENRICQMIVAEFSHFKEVLTMVWNEETCQKPADVTVHDIRGERRTSSTTIELDIDSDKLLQSYWGFEERYKFFLAEYLAVDADLNDLVHHIIAISSKLGPINCTNGWGKDVKSNLPTIIAGVFAVFTVLKSAASYNRIEDEELGEKILMKPHNIQVLTLLCLLGCGDPTSSSLENQVMQIRTGEGKSLILGAAAVVLALLGFKVRCICYSEYLSNRDFELFRDLFGYFQLSDKIKYSKITTLSEDSVARKGDIRKLTESLLNGRLGSSRKTGVGSAEATTLEQEILVVDEFDVFFGSEFYGQTYNQVVQLRDLEVAEILKHIWTNHTRIGRKQKLGEIQATEAYRELARKYAECCYLLDNEIGLMIDQVKRVDEEPYYLDKATNRIGYKVMDTIQYDVTYGYCTMFAYLQEAEKGNLKDADSTLAKVLAMSVSCGQFSYANVSATRVLGVSGTVEAMGQYEHEVLAKYGIEKFVYIPSVYGKSNFKFDIAGEGIFIESTTSDFFHRITDIILEVTKQKRAAIVFFRDVARMREFTTSPFFKKLGRHARLLTEDMNAVDKNFVVTKAATAGQITLCTSVFGRGTDFFCKDDVVQKHGGVHIIQAFLSEELSEEVQIKGRTARQGKKGSYQMILLETDLKEVFDIEPGEKDKIARENRYEWLSSAREEKHRSHCYTVEANLEDATDKDKNTHEYFDALLDGDSRRAQTLFKELYFSMKTQALASNTDIDMAFLIDVTGSMGPYSSAIAATIKTLVDKQGAVMGRPCANYPDTEFKFRVAVMGFRDIDDGADQFREGRWGSTKSHFTENTEEALRFIGAFSKRTSGGGDLAEDVLGAIARCTTWNEEGDWNSRLKFLMVLTDAAAHGLVDPACAAHPNSDNYETRHPDGLTTDVVVGALASKGIDLLFCSFNPSATSRTEQELSQQFLIHPANKAQREVTLIPLVPSGQGSGAHDPAVSYNRHIVFVLDESGSMCHDWNGVVQAYNQYIARRLQYQCDSDLVSVVQFDHSSRVTIRETPIRHAPKTLHYHGGGTCFHPASQSACEVARGTTSSHVPVVVFMSDGCAGDAASAASLFSSLNTEIKGSTGSDLELHVIAFRSGADMSQLGQIVRASPSGKLRTSTDTSDLSKVFEEIAGGANVAGLLEAEIGKRLSDAVGNKLALEFMG